MNPKPNYQELERKIKQLEQLELKHKDEITFLKERERELKFLVNEFTQAKETFYRGCFVILKVKNEATYPIETVTPNIVNLLGYSMQELSNQKHNFYDLIHPESRSYFKREINKISCSDKSKSQRQIEYQLISKANEIKWVDCQIIAIKSTEEEIGYFQLIISDISKQKQMEQALKKSEEKYRLLFENSPMGVYIADSLGNVLDANTKLIKMLGAPSLEEMKKINILQARPLIQVGYSSSFKECIETGKIIKSELQHTSKWGQIGFYKGHLVPIKDKDGKVDKVFTLIGDITEQKEAEETLKQSEKALKIANTTKDKFFSIIAHDLRNPFNTMLGFIQVLLLRFDNIDKPTLLEYLKIIEQSAKNSYNLLDDLLLWANNQRGAIKFKPILINLYKHIDSTIEVLINTADKKDIKINHNVSGDIFLYADKEMLSVVIRNLMSNAIKFTDKGGKINIYSKIKHDKQLESFVELTVEDSGKGMSPETLSKLFRIDQDVSTKGTDDEPGTGLGLVLCKEFIEKHDGTIHVKSVMRKGSKFILTLPVN